MRQERPSMSLSGQVNPPKGLKSDFVKLSITMPPMVYDLLAKETTRRKIAKERDPSISAVIREAVVYYLNKKEKALGVTA